jgi:hypothetical protein
LLAELITTTQLCLPAFLRLIDPSPGKAAAKVSQLPWRASRHSGALEGMKQVGILQPCPKSSLKACAVLFPVLKSSGTDVRAVVNPYINRLLADSVYDTGLPLILLRLVSLSQYKVARTYDGVSMFYQHPMADEVAALFTVKHEGSYFLHNRTCMGYKHAVALSQRTLQLCILEAMHSSGLSTEEVDGEVWVDNIILVATSLDFLVLFEEHFLEASKAINLNCVAECEAGHTVVWVGLELNFEASTYCLTPKWCQKVRPLLDMVRIHAVAGIPLISAVYQKYVGVCTYACYIQRQPMLLMSPLFGPLDPDPKAMVSLDSI